MFSTNSLQANSLWSYIEKMNFDECGKLIKNFLMELLEVERFASLHRQRGGKIDAENFNNWSGLYTGCSSMQERLMTTNELSQYHAILIKAIGRADTQYLTNKYEKTISDVNLFNYWSGRFDEVKLAVEQLGCLKQDGQSPSDDPHLHFDMFIMTALIGFSWDLFEQMRTRRGEKIENKRGRAWNPTGQPTSTKGYLYIRSEQLTTESKFATCGMGITNFLEDFLGKEPLKQLNKKLSDELESDCDRWKRTNDAAQLIMHQLHKTLFSPNEVSCSEIDRYLAHLFDETLLKLLYQRIDELTSDISHFMLWTDRFESVHQAIHRSKTEALSDLSRTSELRFFRSLTSFSVVFLVWKFCFWKNSMTSTLDVPKGVVEDPQRYVLKEATSNRENYIYWNRRFATAGMAMERLEENMCQYSVSPVSALFFTIIICWELRDEVGEIKPSTTTSSADEEEVKKKPITKPPQKDRQKLRFTPWTPAPLPEAPSPPPAQSTPQPEFTQKRCVTCGKEFTYELENSFLLECNHTVPKFFAHEQCFVKALKEQIPSLDGRKRKDWKKALCVEDGCKGHLLFCDKVIKGVPHGNPILYDD
ncbi:unnamed protein product, partial [Mesorhabditis belari]|uniref:Uncharacterized protein n=2 Tax=Mesorhabditis belari TaxID=2138241 RepID=A0AAF3JAT0_9BILA